MLGQVQEAAAARRSQEATTRKELLDRSAVINNYFKQLIKQILSGRLDFTERQLEMLTAEMKDKICALVEDVEYKVARGLSEEIRRLAVLVHPTPSPFSSFLLSPIFIFCGLNLLSSFLLFCGINSSP